jgi:2-polyprenyl-6-methoxyphenol hydroxylase-like FAD-dependent oxidoreductase
MRQFQNLLNKVHGPLQTDEHASHADEHVLGDIVQIASNATRILAKWGHLLEEVKSTSASPASMRCQNQKGELLLDQDLPSEYGGFPNVYSNRGKTQKFMYEYAILLGVKFNFNSRVAKYIENANGAGVVIDGKEHLADGVVGADGVHSRARALIVGKEESPKPSGFSVFRSWFPLEKLKGQPLLEDIVNSEKDLFRVWIGPNTHAIVLTNVKLQYVVCFCTHKVICHQP